MFDQVSSTTLPEGSKKVAKEFWMKDAVKPENKGKLRAKLGVKGDKDIPAAKLNKAAKSKNSTLKKEATLAKTFKKYSGK